ncbi:MAG TPA: DUF1501 domain-containing protein, partial [Casimicrobium huifangae]|nr:DUF1501 domain-containing protein [Casimicrobium huifangae]
MKHTRREFLHALSAGAAVASLSRFGVSPVWAQSAPTDYKALVCIFLFGGNDGNNVVIGADTAGYTEYSAVRGAASGINIAQSELLTIQPKNTSRVFGLHPSLAKVHPLFASGQLAVLANVGPLNRPTTKAAYLAGTDNPYQLFSHADQQAQWQTTFSDEPSRTGWGGRLADAVKSMNGSAAMPVSTSIAGNVLFAQGSATSALTVPSSGTFGLSDNGTNSIARARQQALAALLG